MISSFSQGIYGVVFKGERLYVTPLLVAMCQSFHVINFLMVLKHLSYT